jgi:hypothetical protein
LSVKLVGGSLQPGQGHFLLLDDFIQVSDMDWAVDRRARKHD